MRMKRILGSQPELWLVVNVVSCQPVQEGERDVAGPVSGLG
jgi:hypothetical protein